MFLRTTTRKKDGKVHRYWSVVENRRVKGGRVTVTSGFSPRGIPSGHASFYFALAMGVYLSNKNPAPSNSANHQQNGRTWYGARAGWVYFALAGLMGFARVFVSVHWPLDILAGAVLGIATAVLVNYLKQNLLIQVLVNLENKKKSLLH